ncbi:MAG: T9SS C-terminal target domain-containing protein, partial [Calditrichaeota bacterium]
YQGGWQNFWQEAKVDSPAFVNAMDVHPHWHGNLAWAVGVAGNRLAAFKSINKGRSWNIIFFPNEIRFTGLSLAIHPLHPDSVYVGLSGSVIMTPDSGKSWKSTGLAPGLVIFKAIAVDPFVPENIYAGGIGERNSFAFYHSRDAGKTWTSVLPPEGQPLAGVTDIQVMVEDLNAQPPRSLVFLATAGTGVWLYRPQLTTDVKGDERIPVQFHLHQNYPNPFNPETTIEYELAEPGRVRLTIYNLLGQRIRTLVDEWQPVGRYRVQWNGSGERGGRSLASGVYVYELRIGDTVIRKKMILLR